jgi:glycerol uptake facilitator-like aquaporin
MDKQTRALIAEFLGTFTLVFIGVCAVASGQGVVVAALAHGFCIVHAAYSYGHLSGAHLNPAVTLGLLVGGKIEPVRGALYIVVQFIAGIIAAFVAEALVGAGGQTTGSLTAGSVWTAAAFEAILTFLLVSVVYQAAVFGKAGNFAGLAIALTLVACILAGGTYTGASLNPSRTLGPALAGGDLSYVLPYLIGIFGGGVVGGLVQTHIVGSKD